MIACLNQKYTEYKWRERKVSYGNENPDKIFYIVRRAKCKTGLFSRVITAIGGIKYALDHGYLPVVHMQDNIQKQSDRSNIWELFFEQPCNYDLQSIKNSKNIILGDGLVRSDYQYPDVRSVYDDQVISMWREIAHDYLRIKPDLLNGFQEEKSRLFSEKNVLGVLARGTDYIVNKPRGHQIQPNVEQLFEKVDRTIREYECDAIYLATEDVDIYESFVHKYGNLIIAPRVSRYRINANENINDVIIASKGDYYTKQTEYLKSVWMLSQCGCFIAGSVSGTVGVLLMTAGFQYQHIFNLGVYE